MRLPALLTRVAVVLLGLACQPRADHPTVYGPWEEGLTLAFEDPSQAQPVRTTDRLQVRVARSALRPGAPGRVELDLASLQGHVTLMVQHQAGGMDMVDADGRVLARLLPAGFPDLTTWEDRGTTFRVVGRAAWDGASILPSTADPIGIWVEARPVRGDRRRTLYLPNLGEVESQVDRDGRWVTVNRLVATGFVDAPVHPRP